MEFPLLATQVTPRASKQHRKAAVKPLKSQVKEEEKEEKEDKADGPRKGRARGRRKVTAAPALPEVPPGVRRSSRTSARRGKGETGTPCGFDAHVGAVGELPCGKGAEECQKTGEEPVGQS